MKISIELRIILLFIFCSLAVITGCTDSESEDLIEGHWYATKLVEDNGSKEHNLPNGIHMNFSYPKYSFKGEENEDGNYYIKNDQLHLIPKNQNTERDIKILKLSSDSLVLKLVDSLEIREVQFLRNKQ